MHVRVLSSCHIMRAMVACRITRPRAQEPLAADALITHGILEPKSYDMPLSQVCLASVPCAHVLDHEGFALLF